MQLSGNSTPCALRSGWPRSDVCRDPDCPLFSGRIAAFTTSPPRSRHVHESTFGTMVCRASNHDRGRRSRLVTNWQRIL